MFGATRRGDAVEGFEHIFERGPHADRQAAVVHPDYSQFARLTHRDIVRVVGCDPRADDQIGMVGDDVHQPLSGGYPAVSDDVEPATMPNDGARTCNRPNSSRAAKYFGVSKLTCEPSCFA